MSLKEKRRKKEGEKRGERMVAQVWHDEFIGGIHALYRRWKREQQRGKGTGFPPEGRKEGSRAIHDGKSNQLDKDPRYFAPRSGQGEITCVWRQLSSSRFDSPLRCTEMHSLVDQSLSSRAVVIEPRNRCAFARRNDL